MKSLKVFIEISGTSRFVGFLFYSSAVDAVFKYDASYLASKEAVPISISLPLQEESLTSVQTKNFFEGLLPEGFIDR